MQLIVNYPQFVFKFFSRESRSLGCKIFVFDLSQSFIPTCRTMDGTEKIMASLKMGLVSSLLVEVFFLLIFRPSCSR